MGSRERNFASASHLGRYDCADYSMKRGTWKKSAMRETGLERTYARVCMPSAEGNGTMDPDRLAVGKCLVSGPR